MHFSGVVCRDQSLNVFLKKARRGSAEALGQLFKACHGYLLTVARQELASPLQAKVDAADVVQETFIEATRDFAQFRGENVQQLLGWMRCILRHNLADLTRRYASDGRCLHHEVRLRDHLVESTHAGPPWSEARTVCEQLIAQERQSALDEAVRRLPPAYRQVIQLRYRDRSSFADIGNHLHRSAEAVRKLWCRALVRLRHEMRAYSDS